ncbi:MAG: YidC/Oxa1 family membrane protein insertase [Clostridia bacterium]|nr:YidC/Oxa1 family membrane protein insertase [Clostridia bacterium]
MFHNYGVEIILFTIVTRILLLPLTISQQKSSAKMARIRPKMDELKQKYGNDREKYNAELQRLYEKEGVSSASGCLPMLIQFPIIIGLFSAMREPLTLMLHLPREAVKSFATSQIGENFAKNGYYQIELISKLKNFDLSQLANFDFEPEHIEKLRTMVDGNVFNFLGINLLDIPKFFANTAFILTIVVVIAQFLSMYVTQKYITPMQETPGCNPLFMNIGLTLMIGYFSLKFPAAISLYYAMTSILAPFMSYFTNKFYSAARLEALAEAKRMARIKLDEAAAIQSVTAEKGEKTFLPDYSAADDDVTPGNSKKKKK